MMMPQQKPGRSKQDYCTPPEFLDAVRVRLGIIDFECDLAADDTNYVTLEPWFFDIGCDALQQSWRIGSGWNWCNPPYADIEPWVQKAHEESVGLHGANTAVLIPAAVGANWWRKWVHNKAHVLFLNGRLTFVGADGPYPKDCALLLYGGGGYDVWNWRSR